MKRVFKNHGTLNIKKLEEQIEKMANLLEKVRNGVFSEEVLRDLQSELCCLQDDKGAWCIADLSEMDGDLRFEFFYIPTMYATAILIETMDLQTTAESQCLAKALALLEERRLQGHGYDALRGYLRGISILRESVEKADQKKLRQLCPRFMMMWKAVRHNLEEIQNSELSWWIDEEVKEVAARILKEFNSNEIQDKNFGNIYFAYGSNMSEEQMSDRCKDAQLIGPAWINDFILNFRKSSRKYYATLDRTPGEQVEGLLWYISQSDEKQLDRYEGVHSNCYRKEVVEVQTKSGSQRAMVYLLPEDRPLGRPQEDYLDILREAYRKFSFDQSKLDEAYARSIKTTIDDNL